MISCSRLKLLVVIFFLSIFFFNNAYSQTKIQDSVFKLEEVIVTAQKRSELLHNVPFAISNLSAKQIEDLRLWQIKEITSVIPNFYSSDPGDGRDVTSLRGIATTSYDPATTVYIDGVNQFGLDTYIPTLFDVERIEVLRGPQSTLYGRNAMAGVINIITKQPSNTISGSASYSIGNYGQNRMNLSIKAPIIKNKLFFGASILYDARNGYYTNQFNNKTYDKQNGFFRNYFIKYIANHSWSFLLNIKNRNQRNNGAFPLVMGADNAIAEPFSLNQNATTTMIDNTVNASLSIHYSGHSFDFLSQTAYQSNYRYYTNPIDGDFSPYDAITVINNYGKDWNKSKVYTQEFKITSPTASNNPLKYTAGAYLFYQDAPVKQGTRFGADANSIMMVGDSLFTLINSTKSNKKGVSFYGQLSYAITPKLNFTAGLRNDYEDQTQTVKGEYQHDPMPKPITIIPDTSANIHFSAWSPKLALDYHFTEHTMGYANYSQGFRTGGLSALSSDPSQPPLVGFLPEHSNNFELGLKNNLWHDRVNLNIAVFYTKVNDAQVPSLVLPDAITITKNVGKLNSKGIEFEFKAQASKSLFIQYSFGYTDASFTSLQLSSQGSSINLNGKKQLFSPDLTSFLALQYTMQINPGKLSTFVRGEWKYLGTTYFDLANTIKQSPYSLFNASAGLNAKQFSLQAWFRNISNQKYIAYAYDFGAAHLGDPSNYGITLSYRF
ncbi:MAG: TonB-dependent receptor [Bacteroidetes bacterium]|nr:TonB-dependent receptor [Bacteroidota bacterium]